MVTRSTVATVVLLIAAANVMRVTAQSGLGSARTVLAAVVSGQGRPVVDVGLDDFVVTEGNAARDILDVHVADYPLAIVLDDRAEFASSIAAVGAAARRFIQRVGERPVALLRLSSGAQPLVTLDDERSTRAGAARGDHPGVVRPRPIHSKPIARAAAHC